MIKRAMQEFNNERKREEARKEAEEKARREAPEKARREARAREIYPYTDDGFIKVDTWNGKESVPVLLSGDLTFKEMSSGYCDRCRNGHVTWKYTYSGYSDSGVSICGDCAKKSMQKITVEEAKAAIAKRQKQEHERWEAKEKAEREAEEKAKREAKGKPSERLKRKPNVRLKKRPNERLKRKPNARLRRKAEEGLFTRIKQLI